MRKTNGSLRSSRFKRVRFIDFDFGYADYGERANSVHQIFLKIAGQYVPFGCLTKKDWRQLAQHKRAYTIVRQNSMNIRSMTLRAGGFCELRIPINDVIDWPEIGEEFFYRPVMKKWFDQQQIDQLNCYGEVTEIGFFTKDEEGMAAYRLITS